MARRNYDPDVKPGCLHLLLSAATLFACLIGWWLA